jgi:hypothetical protein
MTRDLPIFIYKISDSYPGELKTLPYELPPSAADSAAGLIHLANASQVPKTCEEVYSNNYTVWLLQVSTAAALRGHNTELRWLDEVSGCIHYFGEGRRLGQGIVVDVRRVDRQEGESWTMALEGEAVAAWLVDGEFTPVELNAASDSGSDPVKVEVVAPVSAPSVVREGSTISAEDRSTERRYVSDDVEDLFNCDSDAENGADSSGLDDAPMFFKPKPKAMTQVSHLPRPTARPDPNKRFKCTYPACIYATNRTDNWKRHCKIHAKKDEQPPPKKPVLTSVLI